MNKTKSKRRTTQLTNEQMQQLRKDRELIAQELPDLIAKHQRISDAKEEPTMSGALRRAIHSSKILLDDLAHRAGTDLDTLAAFLTGDKPLTSNVIDRLTKILKLKLESATDKPKPRRAKAG
ncbi:MAG: hypothetical protein HYR84_07415 [Planctomycetes bacterium]|nr:hypothetical protein [Planctomycetota bacterium]